MISLRLAYFLPVFFILSGLSAQQWQLVCALPAGQTTALFPLGDTLFAAGLNRIYMTTDAGATWDSSAVIFPTLDYIVALRYSQGRLYVGTVDDGVFSSTNNGQSWQTDSDGLTGPGALDISALEIRGDSLYAGTYGSKVFVKKISVNSDWSPYEMGLPWSNIESVTNLDGTLLAGAGANGTVSYQRAPGHSWTEKSFAPFTGASNSFLAAVRQGATWLGAGTPGLYRSTDQGDSWTPYNVGTGVLGSARLLVAGDLVFANLAKPVGLSFIKYTDNTGLSWQDFEPALTGSYGYDLAWSAGWLYSARSNGLWRIATTTGTDAPATALASLGQNFPNPANGQTTIPFTLRQPGRIELSVCNAAGRAMLTILRGDQPAGRHQLEVETSAWPAGAYYYRLTTASEVLAWRMMVVN